MMAVWSSPVLLSLLKVERVSHKGTAMPSYLGSTSVYRPMVKRPPSTSRRQAQSPEPQAPVAAVPMVGGGLTNVQQPQPQQPQMPMEAFASPFGPWGMGHQTTPPAPSMNGPPPGVGGGVAQSPVPQASDNGNGYVPPPQPDFPRPAGGMVFHQQLHAPTSMAPETQQQIGGAARGIGMRPQPILAPGSNMGVGINSPAVSPGMGGQLAPSVVPPPNPDLNDQRVAGHNPVTAADYQRAGVPIPLSSPERVIGGGGVPGRFGNIGVNQSSGITTTEGGYVSPQIVHGQGADQRYTPPLSQQDQATVNRQRQYGASSFGDTTMIPESYKRFAQGGAFSGQQAEAPYRSSVSRGAPEPGYPNGRPRVDYGVGAPSVALSNEMEQRRQAAVARQTAKREGLATGRKDRALARNNGGFTPTSTANAKPGVERGGPGSAAPQAGPTGPVPGGNNEADHGIKQAALDQTLTHPIFSNEEAQGSFDGKKASVSQSLDFYGKHSGKWSEADKAEFKNYLDSRYGMDKSDSNQFRKDMDNILSDAPSNPGGPMTQENIDRVNAIRKMYGKPPVKTLVVSPDLGSHVVPGQPPRGNTGVGIY